MSAWPVRLGAALASAVLAAGAPMLAAQERPAGATRARTIGEDLQMFTGVLNQIRVNHPDSTDPHALIMAAIRGMISAADPHSYVLVYRPLTAERAKEVAEGRAVPVPIAFRFVGGAPVVVGVAAGSDARRQNVLPGDELVAIDGNPVAAESADELEILLAGRKGSTIRLTFERHRSDGSRTSVVRDIKREKVGESTAVPASFMLDGETGYVLVTTFVGDKVNEDLRKAIDQLERAGMQRLVLDLRDNGGGSVKEAADVAGLFLPSGAVVHVQEGRKAELNETVKVSRSFFRRERTYPIVLLQNENTASAAELVAGALQDHDRALIVGQPSFGKSLMMRAVALPDGSIMWLVMGHSKTPCGRIIQRQYRGITTREYYRRATAERDTVGRPSCRTTKGRTVYGGGGIYPDIRLAERPNAPSWLIRLTEQSVALRWVPGWLESGGASLASLDELARSLVLPAGAVADFRAFAARDGATIPDGADADALLNRWLLPIVADAKWGDAGYYRVHALLDADVREGITAFSQATAILGR